MNCFTKIINALKLTILQNAPSCMFDWVPNTLLFQHIASIYQIPSQSHNTKKILVKTKLTLLLLCMKNVYQRLVATMQDDVKKCWVSFTLCKNTFCWKGLVMNVSCDLQCRKIRFLKVVNLLFEKKRKGSGKQTIFLVYLTNRRKRTKEKR